MMNGTTTPCGAGTLWTRSPISAASPAKPVKPGIKDGLDGHAWLVASAGFIGSRKTSSG